MTFHRILTSVLALAAGIVPVSASTVYCSTCGSGDDQTAFVNATTSVFFPNSAITFTFSGLVLPDQTEYIDPISGVNFFDYNSNGTALDSTFGFAQSGTILRTNAGTGDLIQVALPSNVLAFAADMALPSGVSYCIEEQATFSKSACTTFVPSGGTEFVGVVGSSPISTIWIGPFSGGNPAIQINDFEIGEQQAMSDTPETATFLMLGTGLTSLGLLRRKLRKKN